MTITDNGRELIIQCSCGQQFSFDIEVELMDVEDLATHMLEEQCTVGGTATKERS